MNRWQKVLGAATLAVVLLLGLAWVFLVPGEMKTLLRFSRWHDANLRASGSVDREPPGTRIHWEEFGDPNGAPVVVLHGGLCSIAVMGGQIEALARSSYRVLA